MSWNNLANNQTVSYNNLQDAVNSGVFILKNIIPVPNTRQLTSVEAKYFVDIIPTGKSANQLVVKSNLVPLTTSSTTSTTTTFNPDPYPNNNLKFSNVSVSRDDVTSSNDGKYVAVVCGSNNKLYISNDYGLTYTTVTVAGTNTLYRVAVSGTGEYMYCLSQVQ